MSQENAGHVLALGSCELDLARGQLLRDGKPVALRSKAFDLLTYLGRNVGRVATKSELMSAVWPDVFVTEDSLTQAVRELRKALQDESQTIIRTVAKRGYVLSLLEAPKQERSGQPSVAVLRFSNEGAPEDTPLIDGFAEDIVNALARFGRVVVLARNSGFAFVSDSPSDWRAIGDSLGATYLVRGRATTRPDGMRVTVSLMTASTGGVLWSDTFSASGGQIFEMQEEIARRVVNRLVARLDDEGVKQATPKPPDSLAAYELLLRGLARLRGYGDDDNKAARDLFQAAVEKDPTYALAHSYIALADLIIGGYAEASPELLGSLIERAECAVTLAPEEPRCHRVLAQALIYARRFDAAEHHLQRALDLNPYDADTIAQMGFLLSMRGRPLEALAAIDSAIRINPIHPDWYHYDRAIALYSAGDYKAALVSMSKVPSKSPWRLTRLAGCYAQLGELKEAQRIMAEVKRIAPDFSPMQFAQTGIAYEHASDVEHLVAGVAKALAACEEQP
ncbi:transcriptional regulator [Mesorhizobium sp. WSM4303]|uniref:winged helix-turn-helix domain-containing tetratricopeptide repeat protein n=1 Tax=unclassified Mesorhizobium TaxID=325217 RepID=UPI00115D0D81|nr:MULTISPECIES: winged helix-turn-helix domain-containing protein [unclassified Mesorhizobium]TRC85062.1 transcriptional regulator [Mesorhizobium sp. WSM4306]TRC94141.1 transcriptional regulator [Mesorhizobium sp. WSM4303]